jgi:eukaryotic-like serine/threonine-protein kinase
MDARTTERRDDPGDDAHAGATTLVLDPDEIAEHEVRARRARLRRALALAILASTVVLVAIGYGTYSAVERSLYGLRAATLDSILDSQSKTLEVWIADQVIAIQRLARNRQVREQVAALVAIAAPPGTTPEQYCASPVRRPLVAELDDAFAGTGAVDFNIVDRSGRIIASSFREYCGLRLRPVLLEREFDAVFGGDTLFVHPSRESERLDQIPAHLPLLRPVVWVETPVTDARGGIIAAISVGQFADQQFTAILAAARGGETAEVYAFDRRGKMLSQSRFTEDLVKRGRLAPGDSAMLSLSLRPPDAPAGTLTRLAEAAIAGAKSGEMSGRLVEPYRGYYGRDVVGAWRWLPAYDMGIAVEIGADEAYAPLRVLRITFGTVFGALVLAVIVALTSWFSAAKLRGRISEQRRLGPYVLGERIGQGGNANVYLAQHELLKRPTALKLLKSIRSTDEIVARFEREAKLASQLSHPNMVEIFDYGRAPGGVLYYAMEYLDGATVGDLVARGGPMPVARVVHLLRQVCAGLAEAHGKGLVHRDISATNIMVCRYGGEYDFVKVLDFGLVKSIIRGEDSQTITRTLRLIGTPLYMAPERLRDPADVDARADIYAIGAVAFVMLTGKKMFASDDELSLTSCVLNETPPRVSSVAAQPIPRELDELVAACLAKRREDRPQRVTDLIEVLDALAVSARWTQRDAEAAWLASQSEEAGHDAAGAQAR